MEYQIVKVYSLISRIFCKESPTGDENPKEIIRDGLWTELYCLPEHFKMN